VGFRVTAGRAAPAIQQAPDELEAARRAGPPWATHPLAVGLLTMLAAAAYSAFALVRFRTFQSASYDLVIFDQAVRSYAHLQPGISIMKGLHNGFGPGFSVLGDHWSPILATLAPLYWVSNTPVNLLVAQAVLFALAIPPVWMFSRRAFGGGTRATVAAYLVAATYALSWPIASAVGFDFHEVAFAPVLTAVALERLQAGRLRTAFLALAALLLVKEDMGFLVAGIGIYVAVARPRVVGRPLLTGLVLVVVGLADSVLATYVLISAFGGRSDYYWAYGALGNNVPQVIGHIVTHPASSLRVLITPRVKVDTVAWLLAACCFLSLRSPLTLAAVPLLLERMLGSKFPNWWVTPFQYNAYLVIILLFAAVDGVARLEPTAAAVREHLAAGRWAARWNAAGPNAGRPGAAGSRLAGSRLAGSAPPSWKPETFALACSAAMIAVAMVLVPRFAFGAALHPSFYHRDARMDAAAAADAVVPSGTTVEAVNYLGPQLSGRDTVLLWDGDGETPRFAPWVVADVRRREFTFPSVRAERLRIALLEKHGYQVAFRRDGYVVLHAPRAAR
jgi:uncharacterized membrane protein